MLIILSKIELKVASNSLARMFETVVRKSIFPRTKTSTSYFSDSFILFQNAVFIAELTSFRKFTIESISKR